MNKRKVNELVFAQDNEHSKVCVKPSRDDIVKDVRLVYYAPDIKMPPHSHGTAQFSTLLSGQAIQNCNSIAMENQPGLAEFKPVDFSHSNQIGPNGAVFLSSNIDTENDALNTEFGQLNWGLSELKYAQHSWRQLAVSLFDAKNHWQSDFEEMLLGLLSASMPYKGKVKIAPTWLKLAEEALRDSNANVQQIAQDIGVHRVHLCRVFQAHFGLSVSAYRQRVALQKSIAALVSEKLDIAAASNDAGFSDQSHFTRTLKKHFGVTPLRLKSLFCN